MIDILYEMYSVFMMLNYDIETEHMFRNTVFHQWTINKNNDLLWEGFCGLIFLVQKLL